MLQFLFKSHFAKAMLLSDYGGFIMRAKKDKKRNVEIETSFKIMNYRARLHVKCISCFLSKMRLDPQSSLT